jgi:hypothetical protein
MIMMNRMFWVVLTLVSGVLISMSLVSCKDDPADEAAARRAQGCSLITRSEIMSRYSGCDFIIDDKAYSLSNRSTSRIDTFLTSLSNYAGNLETMHLHPVWARVILEKYNVNDLLSEGEGPCRTTLDWAPENNPAYPYQKGPWRIVRISPCNETSNIPVE